MLESYRIALWEHQRDLDGDATTEWVTRLAALAFQLGHTSRTRRLLVPEQAHDEATYLLRQMELNQRAWAWAHTKDAKNKTNEPKPILLHGEQDAADKAAQHELDKAEGIAARLGIEI